MLSLAPAPAHAGKASLFDGLFPRLFGKDGGDVATRPGRHTRTRIRTRARLCREGDRACERVRDFGVDLGVDQGTSRVKDRFSDDDR